VVAVEVQDQGPGIRPKDRERIFDQFFRSEGQPHTTGAGLGLHLARTLARRHGGDIVLAPSEPGQGARFILTLPSLPTAVATPRTSDHPLPPPIATHAALPGDSTKLARDSA